MKFFAVLFFVLPSCAMSQWQIRALKDSAVLLAVVDKEGTFKGSGTVFAVSDEYLITADHLCEAVDKGHRLIIPDGKYATKSLRIVRQNKEADLCLLAGNVGLRPLRMARLDVAEGARVYAYGAPRGISSVLTQGHAGLSLEYEKRKFRIVTAQVTGGNSGGPLLNSRGRVVGVIVMRMEHLTLAASFDSLKEILDGV